MDIHAYIRDRASVPDKESLCEASLVTSTITTFACRLEKRWRFEVGAHKKRKKERRWCRKRTHEASACEAHRAPSIGNITFLESLGIDRRHWKVATLMKLTLPLE